MMLLRSVPIVLILFHVVCGTNYGGGYGWHDKIPSKIIVKHIPKHVPIYKPYPFPKPVPVPKPVGFLKPLAIAKPFSVPHVVPVIKHFQKPFPVLKGVPFHFPIPLPKLSLKPIQIKIPKPYVVRVPKPYAVAKKFPVAVPVHIPKPYIVPVYKPVPVGVPQKIPKIVPIYKEVPEYVKKPVPVYVEEQPYKPNNYKGTPYIPSGGSYKGSPFPEGISGGHKGSPFPQGIGSGYKGSPFPTGFGGGNKGTPYIPSGKGGNGYHAKGTNTHTHATSAASFLAAHADKLQSQHSAYHDIIGAYSQNQAFPGIQSLGGGIHGGYHTLQGFHNFGGNNFGFHGTYTEDTKQNSNYELEDGHGLEGYGNLGLYARGADAGKTKDVETHESAAENEAGAGEGSYDNNNHADEAKETGGNAGGQGNQGYIGVSITTFNDQGGRGGGYQGDSAVGGYGNQGGYENQGENEEQGKQGYNIGNNQEQYNNGGQGENGYAHPALTLYQLHNGAAATALNYPNAAANYYNTGYQSHQEQGNQGDADQEYGYNQNYQQNEGSEGYAQQQSSYGYQGHASYQSASQQNNQQYSPQQDDGNTGNYGNQEGSYQNEGGYPQNQAAYSNQGHSQVYHNQASYQVNHAPDFGKEEGYGQQNLAAGLQNYGLKAAYQIQSGAEDNNHLQGAAGTVYVRAYDSQGGNQAAYKVQPADNYQAEDTQEKRSYTAYTPQKDAGTEQEKNETNEKQPLVAAGRSIDSISSSDTIVGSANGYSSPEGGETKGGSWRAVQ
ncbi:uncharacterized protein LOC129971773 [Argiope bruennichi]|uniref:uncharacterized protein LOC129971773 n=1 Tax=Argiope bruennichi TaxID=94029 RepID=UPI0024954EDA|nr:uncharacterized protein LOC129971773 [Argiope bruennichi]